MMAWREILARILADFEVQENVSPEWLINPATNRRLKLDQFYPPIGLAVRFVGLTAKGQPRQSEWELLEEAQRNETRAELCRINGVELLLVDPNDPNPREPLRRLRTLLSRCSRVLAQSKRPGQDKATLMPQLAGARHRLDQVVRKVHGPDDLALYAELWRDREFAAIAATRQPEPALREKRVRMPRFAEGQVVSHTAFGAGTIVAINGSGNDQQITVQFEDGRERTFLSSLVAGKLAPA